MKPKKPKARVMWAPTAAGPDLVCPRKYQFSADCKAVPVLVLPLTDLPALQERVARAIAKSHCDDYNPDRRMWYHYAAVETLRAIHPSLAKK